MPEATLTVPQSDIAIEKYGKLAGNRWVQLIAGVIAMIVLSNYQYAFTLFAPGIKQQFPGTPYPKIAAIFSLFIMFQTWPVPVAGFFVDRFGIRKLMGFGAVGILAGWLLGGTVAKSVFDLYIYYGVIAGTGAGIIAISTLSNSVKWFPDRRGLAAGLTAAGFGGGAALTILPIAATISSMGWAWAMAVWGVAQGVVALAIAMILRQPPAGWAPAGWQQRSIKVKKVVAQSVVEYNWHQTLRRPEFYLLYIMFLFVATGGLMTIGNLSQIARSLNVADAKIFGLAIVPITATLAGITNAFSRIMWGVISDKIGREYAMTIAFGLEAILILLMTQIHGSPMLFLLLLPFVFLSWGEIYAIFTATTGDLFGPKHAGANYGMLLTAKGVSSIMAGYGAAMMAAFFAGSFTVPYYIAAVFDTIAALLACFVLRGLVRRRIGREATA